MTGTQYTDDEVRQLLARAAGDIPPGLDLLAGFRARHGGRARRWIRPRLRIVIAAGTVIAAAVAAITVTLTASPGPAPSRSAPAELVRAARITAAQNYRIASRVTSVRPPAGIPPIVITGAYDPARGIGTEGDGHVEADRYDGRYVYQWLFPNIRKLDEREYHQVIPPSRTWIRLPLSKPDFSRTGLIFALQGASFQTVQQLSPQGLVALLTEASHVRAVGRVSGPGWTGTRYSFLLGETLDAQSQLSLTLTFRGTVDVDGLGRIHQLAAISTMYSPHSQPGYRTFIKSITIDFSGFGQPVPVSIPPASQVFIPPSRP
jgi:hypothetical protein